MYTVIAFIIIFGALVFFHELGHFVLAKRAGILCREFAIGMGPKVLSLKKGETVYTIRLLPIGGYVRMAGEDPEMVDIKPGHRIGLILNDKEEVTKIIINNKEKYPNARVINVEDADLEHKLFVKGYVEEDNEDNLLVFSVRKDAVFVENGIETQIAPYDRQFASKSLWQRTLAIFAGPAMNFVLAFLIFIVIALIQGIPSNEAKLGKLTDDGVAISAGLHEGDNVISIDGQSVGSWKEVVSIIQKSPGENLEFLIDRNGQEMTIDVTPKETEVDGKTIGLVGVYSPMEKSPLKSIQFGAAQTYNWTKEIFGAVGKLVTGQFSIDALGGPVAIYQSTDTVAQSGVYSLMNWAAVLSINLGIMNLLPLPALDGGRLLFFAIEAVRGKPIDRQKEGIVHFIGFALLMLLMIVVTWNDIQRFFIQ
ncbi:RIP metalloprotease RseP [Niallia circulans]|uniref:RIP metalloprotease RseP n=1 Tax=Niallia circulans TaxID=1397 RepID=UPI000BA52ADE|nr:RIP metalloprotease RseP [Niallia circulans]PAD27159.1 RIP metalloprotease RseP [Niallia circulans]PAD89684.1 RIP metalloprotease RseP [Niallia circulans]